MCFEQYEQMMHQMAATRLIELKSQNKIYVHPLAQIQIPIKCLMLSEYAKLIRPKLKVSVTEKSKKCNKFCFDYDLFSTEQWKKDLTASYFLKFTLKIPNLTQSTNLNPARNYCENVVIKMVSDHTLCAMHRLIDTESPIIVSNALSVDIVCGFVK